MPSWPSSWSRTGRFFAYLGLICALAAVAAPHVRAQPAPASTEAGIITLNDRQSQYDAVPFIYHTRDAENVLGAKEIFLRHKNNLRGDRLSYGPVNLSFDSAPHWLIVDIVNKSRKSDWVFDFGPLSAGRTGLAQVLFVQDGERGTVMIDALPQSTFTGKLVPHTLPLRLMPDQKVTLVMYVVPPDHAPFIIAPRIVEAVSILDGTQARSDMWLQNTVLTMMAGCVLFFMGGMLLRRGAGFFPHALFFLTQTAWFWLAGNNIYAGILGGGHIAGVAMATGGLLALAITQSIVASQDGDAGDSLLLYICASFVLLAIVLFVFIIPEKSVLRLWIAGGATALGYGVAAIKALGVRKEVLWAGRCAALAWIGMIAGCGLPYLAGAGFLPLDPLTLQAQWLAMPFVCVMLVLSGAAYVRAGNTSLVREVLRQAQRTQNLNRLKASKETADQARLLRVIEREREIMEDLRAREAERTEEMRTAKIAADEANRAKSAFLAVVSHEIRTPMTGIMGMVRLLLDTQMTREQKEFAQTIQDSGDAMLALLNDILDFSKIESGGMDLEIIDFDLHRVINSVTMLMNGHAAQRGIYLQADIDPDAPRFLKGDPTRLRQVLLNITGNAIKFTPKGGVTIRLRTGDPSLVPADKPDLLPVSIAIEDTGIGISEEAQKNLFNPFSQADSSIARKFGGTGLGLAICKRLIEAMGSRIQLHSVEGQGTTFQFTLLLPPGDQAAAMDEGHAGEAAGGANLAAPLTLLVVDDNAINRKVMEGLLARDGHRVLAVAGGQEAIDALKKKPFDLVFMDIEMPEMDGVTAMGIIRADGDARVAATPVIAVTGNVGAEDMARYKAAGMHDTLAKPIDPERLRAILLAFGEPRTAPAMPRMPVPPSRPALVTYELTDEELDEDSFSQSIEYTHTARPQQDAQQNPAAAAEEAAVPPATQEGTQPMPQDAAPVIEAPAAQPEPAAFDPAALDPALFDTGVLTSLRQSLGENQLREMMAGVFAHNRTVLPTMQTAFNENDSETLRGCAHELKGMNGNFGLKAISAISAAIEKACREGTLSFDQMDDLVFGDLPEAMIRTEKDFPA